MSSKNGRSDIEIRITNQKLIDTIVENRLGTDYQDSNWSPSQSTDDIRRQIFQTAADHADTIRRSYSFPDGRGDGYPINGYSDTQNGFREATNGFRDTPNGYRGPTNGFRDTPNGYRDSNGFMNTSQTQSIDWISAHQNGRLTHRPINGINGGHRPNGNHRLNGNHRPNGFHPTTQGLLAVTRQPPRHTLIPSSGSAFHTPSHRGRNGSVSEFPGSNGHYPTNPFGMSSTGFSVHPEIKNDTIQFGEISVTRLRRASQTSPINLSLNRNQESMDSDFNGSNRVSPAESRDVSRSLSMEDGDSQSTQESQRGQDDQDPARANLEPTRDNLEPARTSLEPVPMEGTSGQGEDETGGESGNGGRQATDQDSQQKHWKKEMVSNINQQK